jgi:DNA-binding winged helix-turn-helix (wHTH) protein
LEESLLLEFNEHAFATGRREHRRGSQLVAMEPHVFDLLVYLIENRDRVVSKDDLIASVWGGLGRQTASELQPVWN